MHSRAGARTRGRCRTPHRRRGARAGARSSAGISFAGRVAALAGGPQRLAREAARSVSAPPRSSQRRTGSGNCEIGQALAQQRLQAVRHRASGARQPQRAGRRRGAIVMETALQRGDAALPRAQELLELVEQGPQRLRGCARDSRFHDRDRRAPCNARAVPSRRRGSARRPSSAIRDPRAAGPKRLAKPARGRRSRSPSVRTPMASRRALASSGQRSDADRQWLEPRRQLARIGDEAACAGTRAPPARPAPWAPA